MIALEAAAAGLHVATLSCPGLVPFHFRKGAINHTARKARDYDPRSHGPPWTSVRNTAGVLRMSIQKEPGDEASLPVCELRARVTLKQARCLPWASLCFHFYLSCQMVPLLSAPIRSRICALVAHQVLAASQACLAHPPHTCKPGGKQHCSHFLWEWPHASTLPATCLGHRHWQPAPASRARGASERLSRITKTRARSCSHY